ncbi:MAG TPA: MFS transporter, partial [Thermomicrobiales bacterium]|nr:MFS transporter [Thermomicrobiales bacterium]
MVYLAGQNATQFQISLVSASTYAAAFMFGIQGGMLADTLSKRIGLVVGYLAQALLCLLVPIFWGTDVGALMFIMFLTSAINQIVTPSIKSATALVATPEQLATASSTVSLVGSIASAAGSAVVAPLLIKVSGIEAVLAVGGVTYLVGAIRSIKLPAEETALRLRQALGKVDWRPSALSLKWNARWIVGERNVASMVLVGAIVVAMFEAFNTLIPVYVRDVLESDPANAIYIFAPAGIGFLIGTFLTPKLVARYRERRVAIAALACLSGSMILFGLVDAVAPVFAPLSPLRLVEWIFNVEISESVLAASAIAIPANFGSTAAGVAVQVYINRRVPVIRQGAIFGAEEVYENALTMVAVVVLGAIANVVGAQYVFIFTPLVAGGVVLWLIRYSYRASGEVDLSARGAVGVLTDRSRDESSPSPQIRE